jgi:histone-lysine N-methyltransferase SETMAR
MKAAPHPPYSPDLAPSDFDLFGYIKGCLAGLSFENADELLESVRDGLGGFKKVVSQAVFFEWRERLRKCIVTNGKSVE